MRLAKLSVWHKYFRWEETPDRVDLEEFYRSKEEVFDTDAGGSEISYWVVMADQPRYYRIEHHWGWSLNYESIDNDITVSEIPKDDILDKSAIENLRFVV